MTVACSQILYCLAKRDNNNCSIPRPLSTLLETHLVVWPLCAVHYRPPSQGEVAAAAATAADGIDWLRGPVKNFFFKKNLKKLFRRELRGVNAAVFLLLLFFVVLLLFSDALD